MRIHVHIGAAKTGSSSIQLTLSELRPRLAAAGILYPDFDAVSQAGLLPGVLEDDEMKGLMRRQTPEGLEAGKVRAAALWRRLTHTDFADVSDLILSSEYFFGMRPEARRKMHRRLSKLGTEITYYGYIRDPAGRYLSGAQQWVKWGSGVRPPDKSGEFARKVRSVRGVSGGRLVVKRFARPLLRNGCVVQDFANASVPHFAIAPEDVRNTNESVSAEAMVILDMVNGSLFGGQRNVANRQSATLLKAIAAVEAGGGFTKPVLAPDIAARVEAANLADMDWLARNVSPDFAPASRPGPEVAVAARAVARVADVVAFDEAACARLARDVAARLASPSADAADAPPAGGSARLPDLDTSVAQILEILRAAQAKAKARRERVAERVAG